MTAKEVLFISFAKVSDDMKKIIKAIHVLAILKESQQSGTTEEDVKPSVAEAILESDQEKRECFGKGNPLLVAAKVFEQIPSGSEGVLV